MDGLRVEYVAGSTRRTLVDGVGFRVDRGETIAIVGESGSGKTLSARAIIRLLPTGVQATGGEVLLNGADVLKLRPREGARLRGNRISMIFQDPFTMLNPVLRCSGHIEEVLRNREGPRSTRRPRRRRRCGASRRSASPIRPRRAAIPSSSRAACVSASASQPPSRAIPSS